MTSSLINPTIEQ